MKVAKSFFKSCNHGQTRTGVATRNFMRIVQPRVDESFSVRTFCTDKNVLGQICMRLSRTNLHESCKERVFYLSLVTMAKQGLELPEIL